MAQPPSPDVRRFSYTGVVKKSFCCPVYTDAYPNGIRVGFTFPSGAEVGDLLEFRLSDDKEYLSARTHLGWINVWASRNRAGLHRGVHFVDMRCQRLR